VKIFGQEWVPKADGSPGFVPATEMEVVSDDGTGEFEMNDDGEWVKSR
jgi:hypothetical protein